MNTAESNQSSSFDQKFLKWRDVCFNQSRRYFASFGGMVTTTSQRWNKYQTCSRFSWNSCWRSIRKSWCWHHFEQDSVKFECIADLWLNLYKSFICRSAGVGFADRYVITYLREFYGVKQISKGFSVRIVLELCRNSSWNNCCTMYWRGTTKLSTQYIMIRSMKSN